MKQTDIDTLKAMSHEIIQDMPSKLVVDGNGAVYSGNLNNPISLAELLRQIEKTKQQIGRLDSVIQNIKGRESKK